LPHNEDCKTSFSFLWISDILIFKRIQNLTMNGCSAMLFKKFILTTGIVGLCVVSSAALAQDNFEGVKLDEDFMPIEDDVAVAPPSDGLPPIEEGTIAPTGERPVTVETVPHSGQYYDANSFVPNSALGANTAPREVDPKYEPGSRFVVVRKGPSASSFSAQLVAAQRALKLGRYQAALEMYEGLYSKEPRNARVLLGYAVAQQGSGFIESAITTYEELLRIDPDNTEAAVNMLGLIGTQNPQVAYGRLQSLWRSDSQSPAVAAQLGLTSAELGNIEEALRYLGVAASIEPNNANHYYNMAVITDRAGAYKDAIDYYQKALELDISYGGGRTIPRDTVYDRLAKLRRL
jgi:Tfp pilus assembly protein PilF